MTKNKHLNHPQLTYHHLHQRVKAFSSTRKGGVSRGLYGELNINPYCGDDDEAVNANRQALCATLHIDDQHLLMAHQTHGVEVRMIGPEFFSLSAATRQMLLEGVDALITAVPQVSIGVSTADCIPVLLYDEAQHVAAAVHAGWRGTVKRIVQKTMVVMQQSYGTRPADIYACIGPGISLDNFEVGDEVYGAFVQAGFSMATISRKMEKWHIDLPECNRLQLLEAGVNDSQILNTHICTYNHVDDYFSARQLGIQSGRIYNGIILL